MQSTFFPFSITRVCCPELIHGLTFRVHHSLARLAHDPVACSNILGTTPHHAASVLLAQDVRSLVFLQQIVICLDAHHLCRATFYIQPTATSLTHQVAREAALVAATPTKATALWSSINLALLPQLVVANRTSTRSSKPQKPRSKRCPIASSASLDQMESSSNSSPPIQQRQTHLRLRRQSRVQSSSGAWCSGRFSFKLKEGCLSSSAEY